MERDAGSGGDRPTWGDRDRNKELGGFDVTVVQGPNDITIIELQGEVDIYTAARVRDALSRPIDEGAMRILVDATRVTFLDSTGLGVFVGAERRLRPHGALTIVCGDRVRRLFDMVGLHHVFALFSSRKEALRTVAAAMDHRTTASGEDAAAQGSCARPVHPHAHGDLDQKQPDRHSVGVHHRER